MRPQTRDLIGQVGLFVTFLGVSWFVSIPTRAKSDKDKKARLKMGIVITSIGAGLVALYFLLGLVRPRGYGPRGYAQGYASGYVPSYASGYRR